MPPWHHPQADRNPPHHHWRHILVVKIKTAVWLSDRRDKVHASRPAGTLSAVKQRNHIGFDARLHDMPGERHPCIAADSCNVFLIDLAFETKGESFSTRCFPSYS